LGSRSIAASCTYGSVITTVLVSTDGGGIGFGGAENDLRSHNEHQAGKMRGFLIRR